MVATVLPAVQGAAGLATVRPGVVGLAMVSLVAVRPGVVGPGAVGPGAVGPAVVADRAAAPAADPVPGFHGLFRVPERAGASWLERERGRRARRRQWPARGGR